MIRIPIQSFGDIITNSSSETFCIITSDEKLDDIFRALTTVIRREGYHENNIYVCKEMNEEINKEYITIDIPCDAFNYSDILGLGIEAFLDKHFKDKYQLRYS